MTALENLLFAALGQFAGLSALVGTRIYPLTAPQAVARPYVVWQDISTTPAVDLDGSGDEAGALDYVRVQVTSWAVRSTDARAIDRQARLAMAAATGFKSRLADQRALPFEPETTLYGQQSDFLVWLKT